MRSLQGVFIAAAAALAAGLCCSMAVVGCGDDTSGAADSGGSDSTADMSSDNEQSDSPTGDSPVGQDGPSEAMPSEAGEGSTMMDGGDASDASDAMDAADVMDAADALDAADASDGFNPVVAYATSLAQARCNNWQPCCPADAGPYDRNACVNAFQGYGWEGNLPHDQGALARGHIQINETQALACINAVQGIPCGTQTAAQWAAVTQACTGVLQGTIPIGQGGCVSSFECASNSYCNTSVDGGVCTALAGMGGACNPALLFPNANNINPDPDEICSYLASSSNGLYCDLIDPATSPNFGTCQPLIAAGGNCVNGTSFYYDDQACVAASALCGDNSLCGGSASYPYPGTAECSFKLQDAGGGG